METREIKFRAYIPKLGMMLYGITPYADGMIGIGADEFEEALKQKNTNWKVCDDGIYFADEEHFDLIMSVLPGDEWYWIEADQCMQLQFTGLHDKGGVELYEGDIVEWFSKFKGTDIPTPPKHGVIKYNQQGCCYHINYELNGKHYYMELNADVGGETYSMTSIEKIGTVFENPELLNN